MRLRSPFEAFQDPPAHQPTGYPARRARTGALPGCCEAGAITVAAYPSEPERSGSGLLTGSLPRFLPAIEDAQADPAPAVWLIFGLCHAAATQLPDLQQLKWLTSDQVDDSLASTWRWPSIDGDTLAFLRDALGRRGGPGQLLVDLVLASLESTTDFESTTDYTTVSARRRGPAGLKRMASWRRSAACGLRKSISTSTPSTRRPERAVFPCQRMSSSGGNAGSLRPHGATI
jgi:hypothetical protein